MFQFYPFIFDQTDLSGNPREKFIFIIDLQFHPVYTLLQILASGLLSNDICHRKPIRQFQNIEKNSMKSTKRYVSISSGRLCLLFHQACKTLLHLRSSCLRKGDDQN